MTVHHPLNTKMISLSSEENGGGMFRDVNDVRLQLLSLAQWPNFVYCPINKNKLCSVYICIYIYRISFGVCHLNYHLHWIGLATSSWQWQYLDIYMTKCYCMCKSMRAMYSCPVLDANSLRKCTHITEKNCTNLLVHEHTYSLWMCK
jgi:hypothetical protein